MGSARISRRHKKIAAESFVAGISPVRIRTDTRQLLRSRGLAELAGAGCLASRAGGLTAATVGVGTGKRGSSCYLRQVGAVERE